MTPGSVFDHVLNGIRRKTWLFQALLILTIADGAEAEDKRDINCATAMVQMELTYCAEQEHVAADAALNAVYKQVSVKAKAIDADVGPAMMGAVAALKKAQRAWIDYRDGQCELAGFAARGGTAEPMLVYGCLADVTVKRTKELQGLLEDLSQ